jgi:hypothetical protein
MLGDRIGRRLVCCNRLAAVELPQFTLRDMFVGTTLIGVGAGIFMESGFGGFREMAPVVSGAFIGAGIFALFHRKRLGAAVGAVAVPILFFIALVIHAFQNSHR